MIRTAHSIVSGIHNLHYPLSSARMQHLYLLAWPVTCARPAGSDSIALVDNLCGALRFKHMPSTVHNSLDALVSKWLCRPNTAFQAGALEILRSHNSDWSKLIHCRVKVLCKDYDGNMQAALATLEPRLLIFALVHPIRSYQNSFELLEH